jgi:DHA1 family bicyclomycin/chloramphenicol resistance-like MFS transporter
MSVPMRTRRQSFFLIVVLGVLNALTPFSIDLYLPAFPGIASDLNTIVPRVSLSVSIYFVGFALGQIIYGPLLDRFGRKPPLYFGLVLYILASIGLMTSTTIDAFLIFRFISALGGSAASVASMTMVRDYFPAKDGAKVFSMLMLVLSVSPLLAPSIGSMIVTVWSWRVIFGVLTVMGMMELALVAFALPLAYQPDPSVTLRVKPILGTFTGILKNPRFRVYTFAGSLSFSGLFVYLAGSPSIFMDGFGVSPRIYGAIFAILAVAMIGGGQLNHLLVKWWGSRAVFKGAVVAQVTIGAAFLGAVLGIDLGLVSTTAFLFAMLLSAGICYPNAASLALEPFSRNVGSASSLLGFLQMGLGAILAAVVGILDVRGTLPTATVMCVASVLALLVLVSSREGSSPASLPKD